MIKVGDRISCNRYSRAEAKGLVVDIVIQTPHPILNLPPVTMCQVQWDKGWKQNSYIIEGYLTWEEESNLQLDVKLNRDNKLRILGIC